jgi:FtsH-binding integral membrane protein
MAQAGNRQSQPPYPYQAPMSQANPEYGDNVNIQFEQYNQSSQAQYAPVAQYQPQKAAKEFSPDDKPSVTHIDINPTVESKTNVNANIGLNPDTLRRGFIKKVLVILMIQLVITTIMVAFTFSDSIGWRTFLRNHQYGMYIALAVSIIVILLLAFWRQAFRRVPLNYLLLTLYTLSTAYFLSGIAAVSKSTIVVFSGGFTLFAVFTISIYAWKAKNDLTKKMFFVVVLSSMLLMLLIFGLIFQSHIANVVISTIIGLIFGFSFAVNVQRLSGKYAAKFSLDDYIIAALDLYIDIVQIFLAVLGVSRAVGN